MRALSTSTSTGGIAGLRESAALELRFEQLVDLGERHVDRHADRELAVVESAARVRAAPGTDSRAWSARRHDARFRLHADGQASHCCASIFGCAAAARDRAHLQPQLRQAGLAAAERNRAAHLGPFAPQRSLDDRIVAQARLQRGDLRVDLAVDQRLHLGADIDLDAGDRDGAVAERDLRRKIGFEPPGRRQRGRAVTSTLPRISARWSSTRLVSPLDLLADAVVEQPGERRR